MDIQPKLSALYSLFFDVSVKYREAILKKDMLKDIKKYKLQLDTIEAKIIALRLFLKKVK